MPFDATPPLRKVTTPVATALVAAQQLISDPKHWGKGKEVTCDGQGNYKFCMAGAIMQVASFGSATALAATQYLAEATKNNSITSFNDLLSTKHTDVMHAFQTAIWLAQEDCA